MATSSAWCVSGQPGEGVDGFVPAALRLVRIDRGGAEHLAGGVGDRDLDAGPEAGVQADRGPRAGRGGQQQVAQVGGEHPDRLVLGRLPEPDPDVHAQVHQDAGAPGPVHGGAEPRVGGPALVAEAEPVRDARLVLRVVGPGFQGEVEDLLLLAAEQGQHAVRGQPRERLAELEVVGELGPLLLLARADPGGERAAGGHRLAQLAEQVRVFGEPLDQDGAGALQGGVRVGDAPVRVDEGRRPRRAGSGWGRRGAGRPAAPARPRGRSAPWCAASACRAGRGLPAGPWSRPRGSGPRARRSACPER